MINVLGVVKWVAVIVVGCFGVGRVVVPWVFSVDLVRCGVSCAFPGAVGG